MNGFLLASLVVVRACVCMVKADAGPGQLPVLMDLPGRSNARPNMPLSVLNMEPDNGTKSVDNPPDSSPPVPEVPCQGNQCPSHKRHEAMKPIVRSLRPGSSRPEPPVTCSCDKPKRPCPSARRPSCRSCQCPCQQPHQCCCKKSPQPSCPCKPKPKPHSFAAQVEVQQTRKACQKCSACSSNGLSG